jgi:hypothetical protein
MPIFGFLIVIGGLIALAVIFPFLWVIYIILIGVGLMFKD